MAFIVDVFAQRIVAWNAATTMATDVVMTPLRMALWQRDRDGYPIEPKILISPYRLNEAELIRGPAHAGRPLKAVEHVELASLSWVHWQNNAWLHGYVNDMLQQSSGRRSTLRSGPTRPRLESKPDHPSGPVRFRREIGVLKQPTNVV
ncbi:hypothetical protein [Dietzia sp. B32]|uniref:hypothetical protein n=1 Tax=Dietzia sp. B32 TaxID=2915130 RepID=UPI0037BFCAE6